MAVFAPVVEELRKRGHDIVMTAREHAETVDLALEHWQDVIVVGGGSPATLFPKATAVASRAHDLARLLRTEDVDVALSHGSYAQALAAATLRVPLVTLMDYEHQPANHLSFRLAQRVIVPAFFPSAKLRRCGASARKVLRYEGFKEELYLADFSPDPTVVEQLHLDRDRVLAVFREPPSGALYHRTENRHFEDVVDAARCNRDVQLVLLPRGSEGLSSYSRRNGNGVIIPPRAIDALSLIAHADVVIGGGGTMTRESALLGTPTYTVFMGPPAAADAALMQRGLLSDLRPPAFVKRTRPRRMVPAAQREKILLTIEQALMQVG